MAKFFEMKSMVSKFLVSAAATCAMIMPISGVEKLEARQNDHVSDIVIRVVDKPEIVGYGLADHFLLTLQFPPRTNTDIAAFNGVSITPDMIYPDSNIILISNDKSIQNCLELTNTAEQFELDVSVNNATGTRTLDVTGYFNAKRDEISKATCWTIPMRQVPSGRISYKNEQKSPVVN